MAFLSNPSPIVHVGGAQRALPDALLLVSHRPTPRRRLRLVRSLFRFLLLPPFSGQAVHLAVSDFACAIFLGRCRL